MSGSRGSAASLPRLGLDDVLAATARPVPPVPGQSSLDDVPPEPLRIGSLFSGYGGLDMGVQMVLGGEVVWHCQHDPDDRHQYAARILAHHWPTVPNLGDITGADWREVIDEHGEIDVLTGGFPCTDLSSAGQRLGLMIGTRSGLWHYMLNAIRVLQPRLVVIENVRGILSTQARGGMDPCPCCVEYAGDKPLLRALGAVLGDLATIGFDAEWAGVRASDVKAPHERFREFILAWPAAADAAHLGHERGGRTRDRGSRPANRDQAAADAVSVVSSDDGELPRGRNAVLRGVRKDAARRRPATTDAPGVGHRHTRPPVERGFPAATVGSGAAAAADTDGSGRRPKKRDLRSGQPDVAWGDYEHAIRRWEAVIGRPHAWPTDDRGHLAPQFSEWMQGLPAGHVCTVPGAPGMSEVALRNARLRALGNGVIPLQSAHAVRLLLSRVEHEAPIRWLLDRAFAARIAA